MKKLKNYLESVDLNYKKEFVEIIIVISLFLILGIILVVFHKIVFSLCAFIFPELFILFKWFQYSSLKDKMINSREDEFVNVINYLEIFMSNNLNVYNSFLQIKTYTSPWMRENIDKLLSEIDEDKSVDPFVHFAKNFKKPIVENVMVSIYQMMEEGDNSNQLNQFDILFQRFSENHHQAKISQKIRKIDSLATFPLIGAGMVTIILTFGIVTIMGDIINVI